MREFSISLRGESIRVGLRKSYKAPRNSTGLVECQNLKVGEEGLVPYDPLEMAIPPEDLHLLGLTLSFPNPQLIQGREKTFLVHDSRIFMVNESDWTVTELELYDYLNQDEPAVPLPNGMWQLADMGEAWLLTNGKSSVFHTGLSRMFGSADKALCQSDLRIQAACEFRGRMILGGFDPENFWKSGWQTLIDSYASKIEGLDHQINTSLTIGENFVLWSPIGFDLFWLFDVAAGKKGVLSVDSGQTDLTGYGDGRPFILEAMLRNDLGWMPMKWPGKVLMLRPLGKGVVVYGEGGISVIVPVVEPEPTFALLEVSKVGVNNVGAAGGDDSMHIFLNQAGDLCAIGEDYKIRVLGYREFFSNDLDTQYVVNYDRLNEEFYICNGMKSWVLTKYGLSSSKQVVTSVGYRGGVVYGIGGRLEDEGVLITTGEFDNGSSEFDTIQWIKIGCNKSAGYEVAVDFKYTDDEEFERSSWVSVNENGAAYLGVSGKSFRVALRATKGGVEPPDWIEITFKKTDRRFTRGINVMEER